MTITGHHILKQVNNILSYYRYKKDYGYTTFKILIEP